MKFPRTIRLDTSDMRVFAEAAEPGEWAVTGAFRFAHRDPATLRGKELQAFKQSWLGLESFGCTTLVEVMAMTEAEYDAMARRLAAHFMERYGAPDVLQAMAAAQEEMAFAQSLCDHPAHTLLSLQREFNDQGLIEKVRVVVKSRANDFSRVWAAEPET